ncbi:hypothetical protein FDUTEX481_04212 [Tolypothrix sp. PCC 7601]|nr:hypothetical protein FDUTEX481_04212 [Tolypothrix sp. PCC 7601]BAY95831.1 hypothetical protein NIES3275_79080 [Microchaete diplosiphon NIES-3275]
MIPNQEILININTLVRLASKFKPEFASLLKDAGYLSQYNQYALNHNVRKILIHKLEKS